MRLLHNLIAVRELDNSDVSQGGIQLLSSDKSFRGIAVHVGPGTYTPNGTFVEMTVKEGDEIIYSRMTQPETIEVEGESLLLIQESNVVAIVK